MEDSENIIAEERAMSFALLLYSAVLLAAFIIGLYGLFSLLWLAGDALERSTRALSLAIFGLTV